ncbi:MAG: hypothetical protein AMXMBFR64_23380 [Myxococcales bacterium]
MTTPRGKLTIWQSLLALILLFGAVSAVLRYGFGLGASTNLSDAFPWGLWIGFDVLVGVGLAAGGFTVAAAVHLFHIEKYEPIARPAVLTAFLGYVLVCVGLLFDLGQPWDIWHPLVMWNPHSVMFEVAWCVMLYTTVLALEFSPVVLERLGWKRPLKAMQTIYIPLVILGVLLSMMHQSSLGTLYVIVPDKLHGLWYTPWLPVFFFISAVAAGLAMTIVESYLSHRAFGHRLEDDLLAGMSRVIVVVLAVLGMWKLQDLWGRGNLPLVFQFTPEAVLFWGEIGLGMVLPMVLFAMPRVRRNRHAMFFAAVLTVMGFIVNRLNVSITGMVGSSGVAYLPSIYEIGVTLALCAVGFTAFAAAVKYLHVFPQSEMKHARPPAMLPALGVRGMPTANGWGIAGLWGLLAIGVVLVTMAGSPEARGLGDGVVGTPSEAGDLRVPADYTFPVTGDSPGAVTFSHESHMGTVEGAQCGACHKTDWSLTKPGAPLSGTITHERMNRGELCGSCHEGTKAFGMTDDDCSSCHN